jgi:hypothetical protein
MEDMEDGLCLSLLVLLCVVYVFVFQKSLGHGGIKDPFLPNPLIGVCFVDTGSLI